MNWSEDELRRIGEAAQLRIASARPDGTPRPDVTIWHVRVGDANRAHRLADHNEES